MRRVPAALFLFALSATACGKRGALVYPEMGAPAAPEEFVARQTGDSVRLSFRVPRKDLAGRSLSDLAGVTVYRQEEQGAACSACATDMPLYRTVYLDYPGSEVQRSDDRIVMLDGRVEAGTIYLYSLQGILRNGTGGAFSSTSKVAVRPALPAPSLRATETPTEIRLSMTATPPVTGQPVGFAIYRTATGMPFSYTPLTKEPVPGPEYLDFGLQRGVHYSYSARSVIRTGQGEIIESAASNVVEVKLAEE